MPPVINSSIERSMLCNVVGPVRFNEVLLGALLLLL